MHTFTIIAGYKGPSTISQHESHTPTEALEDWLRKFRVDFLDVFHLSDLEVAALRSDLSAGRVKPMEDFKSMWYVSSALGKKEPIYDGVFSVHILDTRLEQHHESNAAHERSSDPQP